CGDQHDTRTMTAAATAMRAFMGSAASSQPRDTAMRENVQLLRKYTQRSRQSVLRDARPADLLPHNE
ncbi:MAG: hypothetical protein JXA28_02870, partial [Bacteroidetes bacterium]|nr:hypothetical protein [Bacteroidota bacterium]